MAYKYIGINPSNGPESIVVSDSTTGKAIEISIDKAKVTDRATMASMIDYLENYVETVAI